MGSLSTFQSSMPPFMFQTYSKPRPVSIAAAVVLRTPAPCTLEARPSSESVVSRGGDVTAPQPELPDELVWRAAGDAHASAVDAVEVVGGAEADQVGRIVASSLRTGLDVVRVHRRPAAAWDPAEVLVAGADAALQRVRLLQLLSPGFYEVLRQRHQALSSR